jgi:GTP-binding protein Era
MIKSKTKGPKKPKNASGMEKSLQKEKMKVRPVSASKEEALKKVTRQKTKGQHRPKKQESRTKASLVPMPSLGVKHAPPTPSIAAPAAPKYKTGYVALVGRPNVGKSTLLNRLLGQKVAIVSDKPQTTRLSILGIKSSERGQIIFIDNPGIHKPLHKLNKRMMSFVYSALETADVICLLIDATQSYGHGDEFVLETLRQVTKPVFLLINKVDIIRKDKVLLIIDKYKDLFPFKEIIPISAFTGANLDVLEKCLYDRLPAADKIYGDQDLSDQSERFLLAELIREKILTHVTMELPFVTAVYIDQVERRAQADRPEQAGETPLPAAAEITPEQPPEEAGGVIASHRTMEEAADRIVQEHIESTRFEDRPSPESSSPGYDSHRTIRTGLPIKSSFRPDKKFKGKKAREALPVTYVKASIFVERPNHRQIIIGRQGHLIKLIGIEARQDMEEYLDSRVYLDLQVKVRPNWRDSADVLDLIEGQK